MLFDFFDSLPEEVINSKDGNYHDLQEVWKLKEYLEKKQSSAQENSGFLTITDTDATGTHVYLISFKPEVPVDAYSNTPISVNIPEGVTDICPDFLNYEEINPLDVTLPSTVRKIWTSAFEDVYFKNIKLNDGLKDIQYKAFAFSNLEEIIIPDSVENISQEAFDHCLLKKVQLPKNLITIEKGLFSFCFSLSQVDMPEKLSTIKEDAFKFCKNLKEIKVPDDCSVAESAFDMAGLENFDTPNNNITIVDGFMFRKSSPYRLIRYTGTKKDVVIPSQFSRLSCTSFMANQCIETVYIPKTVRLIEEAPRKIDNQAGAFSTCCCLKSVTFEKGSPVTRLPAYCFYNDEQLQNVELPEKLLYIGNHSFAKTKLEAIHLPDSLQIIGTSAFSMCNLKDVIIPENVKYIYLGAFYSNENLIRLVVSSKNIFINNGAFRHCDALTEKLIPETARFGENVFQTAAEEDKTDNQQEASKFKTAPVQIRMNGKILNKEDLISIIQQIYPSFNPNNPMSLAEGYMQLKNISEQFLEMYKQEFDISWMDTSSV